MSAIAKGEVSSCTNPLLQFFYQENGFLTDLDSLTFAIYGPASCNKKLLAGPTVVDVVNDCPTGDKLSTGRYVANVDVDALSLDPGSYEILWTYTITAGGAEKKVANRFEVLDTNAFFSGSMYRGYISSAELSTHYTTGVVKLQKAINRASRLVEMLTERRFFAEYGRFDYSVQRNSGILFLSDPVIAIEKIEVDSGGVIPGNAITTEVSLDNLRVFNRHLTGPQSPDDRQNPKLEFAKVGIPSIFSEGRPTFSEGVKNVFVTGVFGYTDPDGGPFGQTPELLTSAILSLALRSLQDPTGQDIGTQLPGRVLEAETRDQRIKFSGPGSGGGSEFGILTGDPTIDAILLMYRRPPHVGLAGGP